MSEPTLRQLEDWERRLLALVNEMQRCGSHPSKLENLTRYAHDEARADVKLFKQPAPIEVD